MLTEDEKQKCTTVNKNLDIINNIAKNYRKDDYVIVSNALDKIFKAFRSK